MFNLDHALNTVLDKFAEEGGLLKGKDKTVTQYRDDSAERTLHNILFVGNFVLHSMPPRS